MSKPRLRAPSPAMVVACVALLAALGGTAYAVKKIGPGQIKKGAVKKNKIADEAVTTEKIADEAVTEPKLAGDAVTTSKIVKGAVTEGKLADGSVTNSKVPPGALRLSKVAQVNVNATSGDLGNLLPGECELSNPITIGALQDVGMVLVIPRNGWNPAFALDGYWPEDSETVRFNVCNESAGPVDPAPLPVRILGFN